ncbi:MAG: SDR family NAD(P)-dependent oxidoreductase [Melioribacteraceae bacterium]|nr:SDR family NAD(P)-dependent oxidoreductase [Melioribacteraceae bacterium]
MNLEGKKVIITGAAMGIGFATAKMLLKEGCIVTVWDLNEKELLNAKNEFEKISNKFFLYVADVTDRKRINELVEQAIKDMGSIDILINNAGFVKKGNLIENSFEVWDKTIDINLTSMIYIIHSVLPKMYEKNFGHIVNISSASGLLGVAGLSVYAATKWAVWGLTESMRFETMNANKNIKWTSIHPSYLAKGLFEGAKLNFLGNLIVPLVKSHDVIAKAIVEDALKKEKYCVRRPRSLRLAIILRGLLPDFLFQKIVLLMGVHNSMNQFKGREN